MTDTIGWGDVDVDPGRVRRRRRAFVAVWPVVALVVAAVVVTPVLRSHYADSAAAWLQGQWKLHYAYDDARQTTLEQASTRLGLADLPAFVSLVRVVDAEQVSDLRRMAGRLHSHRTWSGDVARARDAVRTAVLAEVADLGTEIRQVAGEETDPVSAFVPTPMASPTLALVQRADGLVNDLVRKHHVRRADEPKVAFAAGRATLARLQRLTDRPVPVTVVVAEGEGYVAWDLRTGRRRVVAPLSAETDGAFLPAPGRLMLQQGHTFRVYPVAGGAATILPAADFYASLDDARLWRLDRNTVQEVGFDGRPVGRRYDVPAGFGLEDATTGSALALDRFLTVPDGVGELQTRFLWRPDLGRPVAAPDDCSPPVTSGPTAVYVSCAGQPRLVLLDLRSGHRRTLPLPAGTSAAAPGVVSPDGTRYAVPLADRSDPAGTPTRLAVLDLTTGAVTTVAGSAQVVPLGWSADGSVVVVQSVSDSTGEGDDAAAAIGYWNVGSPSLASVRLTEAGDAAEVFVAG